MKKNSSTYIIALLLVVALMASVALVVKKQDTRKGAFGGGQMYLLDHGNPIRAEVGDNVEVQLYVESMIVDPDTDPEEVKVSNARAVLCYGPELELRDSSSARLNVEANELMGFTGVIALKTTADNGDNCINLTVTSDAPEEDLYSGVVRLAKVKFKAVAAGTGEIDIDGVKSKVVGVNPDNTDKVIDVNQFFGRPYDISGASGPTATPTEVPVADGFFVPFKISLAGLRNDEAVCGQDWVVDVIVMGNGKTEVYTGVSLTKTEDKAVGEEVIFTGRVVLGESPEMGSENLALFIKGPMHLQVKYAEGGQDGFYRQSGGQIVAFLPGSDSAAYDFSAYPILAGDVTGETAGVPDGRVNGLDFSYVKSRIRVDKSPQSDGDMLNGDFDGDCWIGNVDLAVLMLTLEEKQDQLY